MSDSRPIYVVRRVTCSSSWSCSQPGPRRRPNAIRCPAWAGLEHPRRLRPAGRRRGAIRSLVDGDTTVPFRSAGRSATASRSTRPVSIATTRPGGRRAPAPGRAVVARSTGNPGQAGRGRDDVERRSASRTRTTPECATWSISTRRRLRSWPTSLARGAVRFAPLQRRRGALRPLPVWRHTGIWDRSSAG